MMTQEIQQYIEKLLTAGGFSFDSISCDTNDTGTMVCSLVSQESKNLIGRDGETLQALNHILKRHLERNSPEMKTHCLIDVNGFQDKKIEKIKIIAHMMAERCRFFKSPVELDPMNPFDRHIIHEYIANTDDLETESTGFGKERRVIIKYKK